MLDIRLFDIDCSVKSKRRSVVDVQPGPQDNRLGAILESKPDLTGAHSTNCQCALLKRFTSCRDVDRIACPMSIPSQLVALLEHPSTRANSKHTSAALHNTHCTRRNQHPKAIAVHRSCLIAVALSNNLSEVTVCCIGLTQLLFK